MPKMPLVERVRDIEMRRNPGLEAWLHHFLTENNIEYLLNTSLVSSPEQLRFMVALNEEQVYLPCSDELFFRIFSKEDPQALSHEYLKAWRFVVGLVNTYDLAKKDARRILSFCRYRFRLYFSGRVILPSRMIKRLVSIVLSQCGDTDPFHEKKLLSNTRAAERLADPEFQRVMLQRPDLGPNDHDIARYRWELNLVEMSRLIVLSTFEPLWNGLCSPLEVEERIASANAGFDGIRAIFGPESEPRKKILFLPDVAGGFMFDIALIISLLRQGHQVVLVLKDAFYFNSPTVWDVENEPLLKAALEDAFMASNAHLTKNELLQLLREHRFVIVSDGTSEQLNLYRTSVTFARAWKECDVILAKGRRNMQVLVGSSHEFTRDIVSYWRDEQGEFHITLKPRAKWVHKFAEKDIITQAKKIIETMHAAKETGKTVMFYSAVIGSIPGQVRVALELVNTFVAHLRDRLDNTFIINPAEHFEEGMDGDDLMYMWEHVQRCGLLDVWRFQTVEDIEASFALLQRKVPSVWSGKDSTFSTGCTKEMRIALDVQRQQPELQIIGPSAEKFFRRRDYGVGKYFDATLGGSGGKVR